MSFVTAFLSAVARNSKQPSTYSSGLLAIIPQGWIHNPRFVVLHVLAQEFQQRPRDTDVCIASVEEAHLPAIEAARKNNFLDAAGACDGNIQHVSHHRHGSIPRRLMMSDLHQSRICEYLLEIPQFIWIHPGFRYFCFHQPASIFLRSIFEPIVPVFRNDDAILMSSSRVLIY